MTREGTLLIFFEELIASLILSMGAPRRKLFWLRLTLSFAASFVMIYFYPLPQDIQNTTWYSAFLRELCIIVILFAVILVSFRLTLKNIPIIVMLAILFSDAGQAMISICRMLHAVGNLRLGTLSSVHSFEVLFFLIYYLLFGLFFGLYKHKKRLYETGYLAINITVIVICIINNFLKRLPYILNEAENTCLWIFEFLFMILTISFYFAVYYILDLQREKQIMEQVNRENYKRYEFTKETIDAINIKCHDLKHKLYSEAVHGEERKNISELVQMYDNNIHSGSSAIDYVLMDYNMRYKEKGMEISFSGNAEHLSFIREYDLVNFLTNAIENAVEAIFRLQDKNKKIITINIEEKGDLFLFTIRNYYDGRVMKEEGRLVTLKKDRNSHGYGIKSMRNICRKYHGNLDVKASEEIFTIVASFLNTKED